MSEPRSHKYTKYINLNVSYVFDFGEPQLSSSGLGDSLLDAIKPTMHDNYTIVAGSVDVFGQIVEKKQPKVPNFMTSTSTSRAKHVLQSTSQKQTSLMSNGLRGAGKDIPSRVGSHKSAFQQQATSQKQTSLMTNGARGPAKIIPSRVVTHQSASQQPNLQAPKRGPAIPVHEDLQMIKFLIKSEASNHASMWANYLEANPLCGRSKKVLINHSSAKLVPLLKRLKLPVEMRQRMEKLFEKADAWQKETVNERPPWFEDVRKELEEKAAAEAKKQAPRRMDPSGSR